MIVQNTPVPGFHRPPWSLRLSWLAVLLAAVVCLPACSRGPTDAPETTPPREARSEVERGPVRLRVEVQPARVRLSDEPKMILTIDSLSGVTVEKPVFAESIGDFRILDVREPLPQVRDDRQIIQQILTLQSTQTGELPIFPLAVTFTDTRPDADGKQHTLETDEVTVEVVSVVESDVTSLDELHAQSPPMALMKSPRLLLWSLVVAALLLAGGVLAWWWRKRHRAVAQHRQLTPRERAWRALQQLWESGLGERDAKQYYVELTGLVRRYIEWTTGVRAPEQTTEEFLREISQRETFPPEERRRLKSFLEAADLVKFAAYRPRAEDIEQSYQRAKEFITYEPVQEEMVA